jgi:hypothetical protein
LGEREKVSNLHVARSFQVGLLASSRVHWGGSERNYSVSEPIRLHLEVNTQGSAKGPEDAQVGDWERGKNELGYGLHVARSFQVGLLASSRVHWGGSERNYSVSELIFPFLIYFSIEAIGNTSSI